MTFAAPPAPKPGIGFVPFVCMIAALMALGAMGIDSMLPNLPRIAGALHVVGENRQQLIITFYMLGFGCAQIVYGSLSDRFGRRPVLLGGLAVYVVFSLIAASSRSFELLLAARLVQGIGAATTRVLPVSIVRDRFEGRDMARVMSLTSMVFMAAPVMAPMVGQTIALVASWRWVFGGLGLAGAAVMVWAAVSLPETLHPENRIPISPARIGGAFKTVLVTREALGYSLAQALVFGGLIGFINSAQQIFAEALHAVTWFPITFAITASFIAVASLLNARLVVRVGMRALSHAALLGFIAVAAVHVAVAASGHENLFVFAALQALAMFTYGLTAGNFSAMAMEKMGHIAGAASSLQGFIILVAGSLIGFGIGQAFNGTVIPVELGFLSCGLLSLLAVLFAEGGRLFRAHHAAPARP